MYAELTKTAKTFGAPSTRLFSRTSRGWTDAGGIQHPASIFTIWSDRELRAIGLARVDETPVPEDKIAAETSEKMSADRLMRTYTLADKPPPPPVIEPSPSDEDYPDRWEGYRREAYPDIGDQLDAILKWAEAMRMDGTDLLAGLDGIVSDWMEVKAKYPKPIVEEDVVEEDDIEGGAV